MTEKPHMRGWTENAPGGGSETLTPGQWLSYLDVTFWGKGEPVLQRGFGERFGKRIESMIVSGR